MSYSYPDILFIPSSGVSANLHSVVTGAPRAGNQYKNHIYLGDSVPQGTGAGVYNLLNDRFGLISVVIQISG